RNDTTRCRGVVPMSFGSDDEEEQGYGLSGGEGRGSDVDDVSQGDDVWTQRYWLELPDKGSPNHLSDVENMRSISIARRSQKFLVEIT
ncbi:hypothetical protein THAOC_29516, partial [Thalassiosira oceanica]